MIIVVLVSSRESLSYQHACQMATLLQINTGKDIQLLIDVAEELEFIINEQEIRVSSDSVADYRKVDLVIFRGASHYISIATALTLFLNNHSIKSCNAPTVNDIIYDKLSQLMQLSMHHIPVPSTVFVASLAKLPHLAKKTSWYKEKFIVKNIHGARGSDNYLLTLQELVCFSPKKTGLYIVQEYIDNTFDYRVLLVGDALPLVMKRSRTANIHQNNTALGATTEDVTQIVSSALVHLAQISARLFNRQIIGVDILTDDKGKDYVLEVNDTPSLTGALQDEKLERIVRALQNL